MYNPYPPYFPYFFPFLFLSTGAAEGGRQKTKIFGKNHQTVERASIAFGKIIIWEGLDTKMATGKNANALFHFFQILQAVSFYVIISGILKIDRDT